MSAAAITAQQVHDAVRACAPVSVRSIIAALAPDDAGSAEEVRLRVRYLLKARRVARVLTSGRADSRVLVDAPARPRPAPVRAPRWRPPMPREVPAHLIPPPALQPRWPAHHTPGAVLAPRLTGGFIHG